MRRICVHAANLLMLHYQLSHLRPSLAFLPRNYFVSGWDSKFQGGIQMSKWYTFGRIRTAKGLHLAPRCFQSRGMRSMACSSSTEISTPKTDRMSELRKLMKSENIDALIIESGDEHQSEYVASCDKRIQYLSGFSGSAGTALVTTNGAWLVTDGRYTIQAANQLNLSEWSVLQTGARQPTLPQHLLNCLGNQTSQRVGIDPRTMRLSTFRTLSKHLGMHTLVPLPSRHPVDAIWESASTRPMRPAGPAFVHPLEFAGQSVESKLSDLRAAMAKEGADVTAISALDEVAWLFNLRGSDVLYSPVLFGHAIVSAQEACLFVQSGAVSPQVAAHLATAGVTVHGYGDVTARLSEISRRGGKFWIDPSKVSIGIWNAITSPAHTPSSDAPATAAAPTPPPPTEGGAGGGRVKVERMLPIAMAKAIKNSAEQRGLRAAHERDGAAMARLLTWLEGCMAAAAAAGEDGPELTELSVSDMAEKFRSQEEGFISLSFATIAASGPNAAITHYEPTPETNRRLTLREVFLLDSGAQGHIGLASARFPAGTTGFQLDVLARAPLWRSGIDYAHGTGHGVGAFLCVHEGPHLISFARREPDVALSPGMTSSIEPGYYKSGEFGMRIENIMLLNEEPPPECPPQAAKMIGFEPLTLIPIQRALIDTSLLSTQEIKYLDDYHQEVWRRISPLLNRAGDGPVREWLQRNTAPISPPLRVPHTMSAKKL